MNHNLEIVLNLQKSISCSLFWCFGGYGTKIKVTGPKGELYGTFIQQFSFFRPTFDILDSNNKRVLYIKGPPIIPFPLPYLHYLSKFKLYQSYEGESCPINKSDPVGIYLESAYGVGNRNMKNCLRVGFPRSLPIEHKGVILASLFQLYFTYYELGDEFGGGAWFQQQLRPLLRMNPFSVTKLTRPYGYVIGKCNPYWTVILVVGLAFVFIYYTIHSDDWNFSYLSVDAKDRH